jgi:putative ubiquitin-RnfH superfamily antitoxin RatB of RatAB toxin-antitoxin module
MARVEVDWVCSPAAGAPLQRLRLDLPAGSCASDALHAAGYAELPPGWAIALWGRRIAPEQALRSGDRVELLRPLSADPMEARRRRQQLQGAPRRSRHRPAGTR